VKPHTIGWSGSPTHDGDWAYNGHARSVARWLRKRGPVSGWSLSTIGHPPLPLEQAMNGIRPWEVIPGQRDIEVYYSLLRMNFDVGLAPLAPTRFNASKSDLRLLELAALGIPWVASDVGPYADGVDGLGCEDRGGVTVGRSREWWTHLDGVTGSADYRAGLRRAGQEWARTRTVDRVLPLWESAFGLPPSTVSEQA
jgi:hypothetical protein